MNNQDEHYMEAALKLAPRGIGLVEPNPVVGAIIVKANQVIGRGWHQTFGGPHAEINAIEDCRNLGVKPNGATMYVTLEPCCHEGKTPPCTQAIISAQIEKIFVAMIDPSEHAGGKGIEQLRRAGIEVQTGICENQAKLLNAPFIKFATTGRSWVTLKWAQSIDGKVAWAGGSEQRWISGEASRKDVHKLRRRAQAILVGINTVIADDPLLTARPSKGKKPLRIVMDSHLRTPTDSQLIATANKCPVIIYTSQNTIDTNPQAAEELSAKGAELLAYPDTHGLSNLHFLLDELSCRGIAQLLVEGGPAVLTSFLRENLADEIIVYIAPKILGAQGGAGITGPMAELSQTVGLHNVGTERCGDDIRLSGLTEKAMDETLSCSENNLEVYAVSEPVNE